MTKDLYVYPYFWQLMYLASKSKVGINMLNLSCQFLYRILGLFPYFLYIQPIPTPFQFFVILNKLAMHCFHNESAIYALY